MVGQRVGTSIWTESEDHEEQAGPLTTGPRKPGASSAAMLRVSVSVPVMRVWIMRMPVGDRLVCVDMTMSDSGRDRLGVLVLMVIVLMGVPMVMRDCLVRSEERRVGEEVVSKC